MNPSPSTQSVGSQKPSTAASTASGRRTRTIIVARNLPDATTVSPSTSTPSSSQSRLAGTHGHGTRDAKASKLSSYAALGGEADVELYERFLNEKKSANARSAHGDPTQLTDGNASPAFLKGSPKRRTMGQLFHQGDHDSTSLPPAASALLQDEIATDAKQRRDAVVQHRKWLKSLPIHERLAYERQQNVIKKWKTINRQWESFKQRTSKKLGKSEKQLVMSRASEYREQIEMYDALQRAMPLSEKVAGDFWLVSLRNEGTRYVPVGNIFSGLYCPIRESSKLQPRVRRPLDYLDVSGDHGKDDDDEHTAARQGKPLTTIERRSLEALERKKRRLKKQLEALYPHEVEPSQSGQLRVDTMDLFEWASTGRAAHEEMRPSTHTTSSRSLLLPLDEEDHENYADASNSQRSTTRSRHSARRKGPSVRVFAPATADANERADGTDPSQQERIELTFFANVGVLQHTKLFIENNGTAALQFQWRREELADEELTPRLTHHQSSPLSEPERIAGTSISQREGVVLPNEVLEFVFSFRAQQAGVWLERWVLDVDPPTLGQSKGDPAAVVWLQSTAVDNFVPTTQRRKLQATTTAAKTAFMAEQVLKHDVITRVDPQYRLEFPELSEQARLFYDAHRRGEFEDVQFSERLLDQCRALYADALAELTPAPLAVELTTDEALTPPTTEAASPSDDRTAEAGESETGPSQPREWDLSLPSLKDIATAADAQLQAKHTELATQLNAERGDQDDEDEDDDDEDLMEKILGTKALKKAAQQAALLALEPHFIDDFLSITLAAQISPYEPRVLHDTLSSKLAAMASEAAVVVEIAQMVAAGGSSQQHARELLRPLLVRALDESLVVDSNRERVFADAKRHFHNVKLEEKADYRALTRLLRGGASLPTAPGSSVVIFLQVDLDIANWFILSPSEPNGPLEWQLAQKLLDHDTHVPPTIAAAAKSVRILLETVLTCGCNPTIVLLSELSTPPMSKTMKRMEMASARAKATATAAAGREADGAPAPVPSVEEIETMRQRLAATRDKNLSLRGVETVLQRAMGGGGSATVEFMGSLQDFEINCKQMRSPRPATPSESTAESTAEHTTSQESSLKYEFKPRIVVMEHLGALCRQALKRPQEAMTPAAPTTPAPVADKGKAPSAADKRKSTAQAPTAQTAKVAAPVSAESPVQEEEDIVDILPGMSQEMMAAQALGQRLAELGHILVTDFVPRSWWEAMLVYFAAPPTKRTPTPEGEDQPGQKSHSESKHILVGPQLKETFQTWSSLFQPKLDPTIDDNLVPIRAVVGGRGLERKLRLIDGLLERVDVVYFAGEIAATIYRVLYTKHLIKSLRQHRKPIPRHETQRIIKAVERLMQKAYRKRVELLLPFDFVVGESLLELGDNTPIEHDEDEEDEEPEDDEDGDADDDDDDNVHKKKSKKQAAPQKPLEEPPEMDTWRPRPSYEGERGVVELNHVGWVRFADVTLSLVTEASVVDGKSSLLECVEVEGEDTHTSLATIKHSIPELDWTRRVFDIGPRSTKMLVDDLRSGRENQSDWVFLNGTLGVVEYREFEASTRQLVHGLQTLGPRDATLVTGKSTCRWLKLLGWASSKRHSPLPPIVSSRQEKLEAVLSNIVQVKPHATLTAFDSM